MGRANQSKTVGRILTSVARLHPNVGRIARNRRLAHLPVLVRVLDRAKNPTECVGHHNSRISINAEVTRLCRC